ncbi:MAG: hypothetical protein GY724_11705 [Actinomycetia bacterium]|nr:hypothetical protein [Actinomycetes bacterium]MCP5032311.1 hypothetical protein [Actinomycetes bacterium]
MAGPEALPRADAVFDEPCQGWAMAVIIETVAKPGVSWEEFRTRLIAAIDGGSWWRGHSGADACWWLRRGVVGRQQPAEPVASRGGFWTPRFLRFKR